MASQNNSLNVERIRRAIDGLITCHELSGERSSERLAEVEDWLSANDPNKRRCDRSTFAFFGLFLPDLPY
jgi:hypothetical protein